MLKNKAVKLVNTMLDFHGYQPVDQSVVLVWLREEVGNIAVTYDLLEAQVEQLMYNRWAIGRLYLTEKRLGVAA